MARKPWPGASIAKEIAAQEGFSLTFTEKILQGLRRAGIVNSQQGNRGGWALTRPAAEITFKEIIEALEGSTFETFCDVKRRKNAVCDQFSWCKLKPIWYQTKETLDELYRKLTLAAITESVGQDGPGRKPAKSGRGGQ